MRGVSIYMYTSKKELDIFIYHQIYRSALSFILVEDFADNTTMYSDDSNLWNLVEHCSPEYLKTECIFKEYVCLEKGHPLHRIASYNYLIEQTLAPFDSVEIDQRYIHSILISQMAQI